MIRLRSVEGAFIHGSRPLSNTGTSVRVEGSRSKNIVLSGKNLARASKAYASKEGTPEPHCS